MPVTKQQDQVPAVSEDTAVLQAKIDQLQKRNKELEEALSGNIPQVSSGPLHNYPDAKVQREDDKETQPEPKQPRTGASAVAKEE